MSFKKAYKRIFEIYKKNGNIGMNQLYKISVVNKVDPTHISKVISAKGLPIVEYVAW